ncbi:hypothetical protein [Arthrobacter sp. MAHUQ-56]
MSSEILAQFVAAAVIAVFVAVPPMVVMFLAAVRATPHQLVEMFTRIDRH